MLSLFKRWLGRDGEVASAPPRTGHFRPELIASLQAEHRELLGLFGELERASEQNDEGACRAALERFTRALQEHLLTENRHLYGYFARNPSVDPSVARRVDSMSGDMMRVGKILHRFITRYARATWTAALHANLRSDLRAIGEVLAHRIHEEETVLYPLYAPRAAGRSPAQD